MSKQVHLRKGDHDFGFWLSKEHLNEARRAPGCQAAIRRIALLLHFSHAALARLDKAGGMYFYSASLIVGENKTLHGISTLSD